MFVTQRYLDFVDSNPQPCILCNNFWMGGGGVYVMSTIATMYDGDQKLKPRSSEKKSNEFLAEETKGRDPPRHNGFKDFLIRNFVPI